MVPTTVHKATEAEVAVFSYSMDHKHQVIDARLLTCMERWSVCVCVCGGGQQPTLLNMSYLSKATQNRTRGDIVHLMSDGLELGGWVVGHGGL